MRCVTWHQRNCGCERCERSTGLQWNSPNATRALLEYQRKSQQRPTRTRDITLLSCIGACMSVLTSPMNETRLKIGHRPKYEDCKFKFTYRAAIEWKCRQWCRRVNTINQHSVRSVTCSFRTEEHTNSASRATDTAFISIELFAGRRAHVSTDWRAILLHVCEQKVRRINSKQFTK